MTGASREPLVSIGVPVRNGSAALARALESLVTQTYRHLEIIISDNASTDATPDICRQFAARDSRISYVRHEVPLTAFQNFRFTFDAARASYFMWAAYDDLRSPNYVEVLLAGMMRSPDASLCFSDVQEFGDLDDMSTATSIAHDFATGGLSFRDRIRKQTSLGCVHVYGLVNAAYLKEYAWYDLQDGPDAALLFYLAERGRFVYEPGATFYYHRPHGRDAEARARATTYRRLEPFHQERLAWYSALGVEHARRRRPVTVPRLHTLAVLYYHIIQGPKGLVYAWLPPFVRSAWRRMRSRRLDLTSKNARC